MRILYEYKVRNDALSSLVESLWGLANENSTLILTIRPIGPEDCFVHAVTEDYDGGLKIPNGSEQPQTT